METSGSGGRVGEYDMSAKDRYVIGIDFGTLSARALLVDVRNGDTKSSAVAEYKSGVIDRSLPDSNKLLASDTALQDPADYLRALETTVRAVVKKARISPEQVLGIGTDFTCCTVLPTTPEGTPLCFDSKWRKNPHAWVKLWKHHAAQAQADEINRVGSERDEEFLRIYGGRYSSEWLFSKLLETLEHAPAVYEASGRFIEAGDWIVWQMTGREKRGLSAAGFKAMRVCGEDSDQFPAPDFFAALAPKLRDVVGTKLESEFLPPGASAGGLTAEMAKRLGLRPGIPVAVGNIDAHAGVTACGVTTSGKLVIIMGTSSCHLLLSDKKQTIEGVCGVVKDGVVPGLWSYEAGQAGVGDSFAWFVERLSPRGWTHQRLEREAAKLRPGQSGLLAIDWWNGSRFLVDADLSGVLFGLKLSTEPHEIYRALIESTAYGTRRIIEAFTGKGIAIDEVYACGGLSQKNDLLLQIYADVTGRAIKVAAAEQASALGSALHAAVAAGVYSDLNAAARKMTQPPGRKFVPNKKASAVYDQLYAEYSRLHEQFGRDPNSVLKRLKAIRAAV
jgi:L-ribulokinase